MRSFWKCWNCFSSKEEKAFKQLKWMKFINQHEIVCSSFFARFCFLSLSFNSLISFSFVLTVNFFSFSSYFSVSVHIGQFLFMFSTFCSIFDLFQVFQLLTSPYFISGSSYYFTYVPFSCSLYFSITLSIYITAFSCTDFLS